MPIGTKTLSVYSSIPGNKEIRVATSYPATRPTETVTQANIDFELTSIMLYCAPGYNM